jgi:hypothetical protein
VEGSSMRIDDGVYDFRFLALLIAFVVGGAIDWFFNNPSEAHWLVVMAAFILLVIFHYVDNIQTRLTKVESTIKVIEGKLESLRVDIRSDLKHEIEMHEIRTSN